MSAPAARLPRPRVEGRDGGGILLLDKGKGMTSNAALQRARRLFRARKAGHTGSLDPLASGLLPVCFGQATKVSGMLLDAEKTYTVTARLGVRTTTGDAEGEAIESGPVPELDAWTLDAVLARFVGTIDQVPPMYSALKQDGRRLYVMNTTARAMLNSVMPAAARMVSLREAGRDSNPFHICEKS